MSSPWGGINDEYEVSEYDREEYAFAIYYQGARARANALAQRDLELWIERGGLDAQLPDRKKTKRR